MDINAKIDFDKENKYQDVAFDYYAEKMALCGTDHCIKVFQKNEKEAFEIVSKWEVNSLKN
jgi:hypothetical protein